MKVLEIYKMQWLTPIQRMGTSGQVEDYNVRIYVTAKMPLPEDSL